MAKVIIGGQMLSLVLALIGLFVPAIFALTTANKAPGAITQESVLVSVVLIVGYDLAQKCTSVAGCRAKFAKPAW